MWGMILLMVQTAPVAPPPRQVGPLLPQVSSVTAPCRPSDDDGDIVICAKPDSEQYRLRPLGPPPNGKPLPPMTMRLGNGTADLRARQHCTAGGDCAPAAMATVKLPF